MKLLKLLFLLSIGATLQGEEQSKLFPLLDSYEYQIMEEKGALSLAEYKKLFHDQNIPIKGWAIQRELIVFENEEELKDWIYIEVAPHYSEADKDFFVECYFKRMREKGWPEDQDGKIRFPRKQLVVYF